MDVDAQNALGGGDIGDNDGRVASNMEKDVDNGEERNRAGENAGSGKRTNLTGYKLSEVAERWGDADSLLGLTGRGGRSSSRRSEATPSLGRLPGGWDTAGTRTCCQQHHDVPLLAGRGRGRPVLVVLALDAAITAAGGGLRVVTLSIGNKGPKRGGQWH